MNTLSSQLYDMVDSIMLVIVIFLVLIVILGGRIVYKRFIRSPHKSGTKIADTPAVVVDIKKISELVTACFFIEKVFVKNKTKAIVDNKLSNFIAATINKEEGLMTDEICLIAKGQIRAGYDFNKITEKDISVKDGWLYIKLPPADILDVIINPKDWDFYVEEGVWSDSDIAAIKATAKQEIRNEAISMGLLQLASSSGQKKVKAFFISLGYKDVVFE